MTNPPSFQLRGRRALVTGSTGGIGAAIATALAEAGADVAIHFLDHRAAAEATAGRVGRLGVNTAVLEADLGVAGAARGLAAAAVDALGGIDILVLNASIQIRTPWHDVTAEELDLYFRVNYRSGFELMQHLVPAMAERKWGRVLTLGSVQERRPHPQMLPYSSLKNAQTGLVISLAKQYAAAGVTFNNLAPGVILTDRNTEALADPAYAAQLRAAIPAGHFGEPDDCAGAALLLCSDAARYITGQTVVIDGGISL